MTFRQYATLVQQLRTEQKASGIGYRTPAATAAATALEASVDAATTKALKQWLLDPLEAAKH